LIEEGGRVAGEEVRVKEQTICRADSFLPSSCRNLIGDDSEDARESLVMRSRLCARVTRVRSSTQRTQQHATHMKCSRKFWGSDPRGNRIGVQIFLRAHQKVLDLITTLT
jgi:hypothetical protein